MDGLITDVQAIVGTYQFRSYSNEQQDRQGAELLIGAKIARHLLTWRPLWDLPASLPWRRAVIRQEYRAVNRRRRQINRVANRCAEVSTLTDLEATVGTYQLPSMAANSRRPGEAASTTIIFLEFSRLFEWRNKCNYCTTVHFDILIPCDNHYVIEI